MALSAVRAMQIIKVCGGAILVAVLGFILSELGFRGKRALVTLGIVIFLLIFLDSLSEAVAKITSFPLDEIGGEALKQALKIIGVGHAFNISSDICAELSEGGIATAIITVGRIEILLIMLPTVVELVERSVTLFA